MDERQRRVHRRVAEVRVILIHLHGHQHTFVDAGLERQAGDVEELAASHLAGEADDIRRALADDVELALEGHVVAELRVAANEDLPHARLAGLGRLANHGIIRRHRAPAEQRLPFLDDDLPEDFFALSALLRVRRQIDHSHPILSEARQREARFPGRELHELVRHLKQNARAVAGVDLAATGAAMVEVAENLQALLDKRVGPAALHVHDEADTAGVMLEGGVVKTLRAGRGSKRLAGR